MDKQEVVDEIFADLAKINAQPRFRDLPLG